MAGPLPIKRSGGRYRPTVVAGTIAIALMVPVAWQELAIARTRADNRDKAAFLEQLRSQPSSGQAAPQAGTDGALEERVELERLRSGAAALRSQLEQARETRLAKDSGHFVRRPGFIYLSEASDAGSATAQAMFQTLLWAIGKGDTNRIIELAECSGEGAQQQKEAMIRSFAEDAVEASHMQDLQFRVVRQLPLPNGDAAVVIEVSRRDSLERQAIRARRVGPQWRLVVDRNGPQEVELGEELDRD